MRKSLRFEVLTRDNYTCRYCGRSAPDVQLEVDHILPRSKGGPDYTWNLVTACYECNRGKRSLDNRDSLEASEFIRQRDSLEDMLLGLQMEIREIRAATEVLVDKLAEIWDEPEANVYDWAREEAAS